MSGATATAERVTYDLNLAKGRKELHALLSGGEDSSHIADFSSLDDYIRDGTLPSITCGDSMIFHLPNCDHLVVLEHLPHAVETDGWEVIGEFLNESVTILVAATNDGLLVGLRSDLNLAVSDKADEGKILHRIAQVGWR
jgi:hypothetical protein